MPSSSLEGLIARSDGWWRGRVIWTDAGIDAIDGEPAHLDAHPDLQRIVPGFVDLHVHGGGGADAMEGGAALRRLAAFHASCGTAALAPTTMTARVAEIEQALDGINSVRREPAPNAAKVLGAHLEGPFINPGKLGAQPPFTLEPDPDLAARWHDLCPLVVATIAPEQPGADDLIRVMTARGCRVQAGHSLATAETASQAFGRGIRGVTHLFNAMSGLDHRAPGLAAAALAEASHAELIADLVHVAPSMLRVAARVIPGAYAITDATAAAGMPDGRYRLGQHEVVRRGDAVWLAGQPQTLAGSTLTMDRAFRNLISYGTDPLDAVAMTSTRAADYLGLRHLGRLEPDAEASLVALDASWSLQRVVLRGQVLML